MQKTLDKKLMEFKRILFSAKEEGLNKRKLIELTKDIADLSRILGKSDEGLKRLMEITDEAAEHFDLKMPSDKFLGYEVAVTEYADAIEIVPHVSHDYKPPLDILFTMISEPIKDYKTGYVSIGHDPEYTTILIRYSGRKDVLFDISELNFSKDQFLKICAYVQGRLDS